MLGQVTEKRLGSERRDGSAASAMRSSARCVADLAKSRAGFCRALDLPKFDIARLFARRHVRAAAWLRKQLSQQIAIAEAAVRVLGEGRVLWHLAIEAEPAEPAVGQVQVHFLAQPPLGTNAVAVTNQQHPHKQFGINRRPASIAVAPTRGTAATA